MGKDRRIGGVVCGCRRVGYAGVTTRVDASR